LNEEPHIKKVFKKSYMYLQKLPISTSVYKTQEKKTNSNITQLST